MHTGLRCALALCALGSISGLAGAQQLRIVESIPGTFLDISSTGTPLNLADDGEVSFTSTIGNALLPAGTVRIAANGGARFGTSAIPNLGLDLAPDNTSLPATGAFGRRQALLPYWDDLSLAHGDVYVREQAGRLIIQWDGVQVQGATFVDRMTFQLQVFAQGPLHAQFVYRSLGVHGVASNFGGGATIGYQGPTGTSVQFALDANHVLANGSVLSLLDAATTTLMFDSLPGTFIDISTTGTPLGLIEDDELDVPTTIRNAVLGTGTVRVGANGGIKLLSGTDHLRAGNQQLPSTSAFSGGTALLPFWDDLAPRQFGPGEVLKLELPDRLIVQWDEVRFFQAPLAEHVTFQVQIFRDSEVAAQFLYADVEGARADRGSSATVGYQAGGIGSDIEYSFNSTALSNGMVLSLLAFGQFVGTPYCLTAANSTGEAGLLVARGSTSLALNDLNLLATDLPANSAAFFLVGSTAGFVPAAGGSAGNLCLGGQIGRVVGGAILNSGLVGRVSTAVDLTQLPSPNGPFVATTGQTLSFQCWFRDSAAGTITSNLTNGVQVQVQP